MKKQYLIKKIPFLPLLSALVIGILLQSFAAFSFNIILSFFAICFLINVSVSFLPFNVKYKCRHALGCLLLLSFVALGSLLSWKQNIENDKFFAGNYSNVKAYFVRLKEPLSAKPKSYKSVAEIEKILVNDKWIKADGDLFVYFKKDSLNKNLGEGNEIIFLKQPQPIRNAGNPGEFDYASYCHRNGIYYQLFLNKEDFVVLPEKHIGFLRKMLNDTREWIIKTIDKNITSHEEASVAKALLIGYRDDLDKDMLQSFTNAGVIHIIAISGMHLVLIAAIFIWLFAPVKRLRYGNIIHPVLVITVLWIFTFIAGAVPSVTRAAIMMSIVLPASVFERRSDIYSSLAFSAFLLLCINPNYLWDAGFMLSYAAVLSIVFFYRPIADSVKFGNGILKKLWDIVAVSLAAQILTLPFVLFYFHQFPVLFLLANVVAVPLSTIILYSEIIMLAVCFIPLLSSFAGKFTQMLITIFDNSVRFVGNIHFAVINGIYINMLQTMLLLAAFFAAYLFIKTKNKIAAVVIVTCTLCCAAIGISAHFETKKQQKIIVYNIPKHTVIDFVEGTSCVSFSDTSYSLASDEYRYILKPAREFLHTHLQDNLPALKSNFPVFQLNGKSVFILNNETINMLNPRQKIDAFILSNGVYIDFRQMKENYPDAVYVFDNTNSFWKITQWKKACGNLHLHFHSVQEAGAFTINL